MARIASRLRIPIGIPNFAPVRQPRFGLRAKSSMTRPKFSAGSDEEALEEALSGILSNSGGRWAMTSTGEGLERTFKFKTFSRTWVSHPETVCRALALRLMVVRHGLRVT